MIPSTCVAMTNLEMSMVSVAAARISHSLKHSTCDEHTADCRDSHGFKKVMTHDSHIHNLMNTSYFYIVLADVCIYIVQCSKYKYQQLGYVREASTTNNLLNTTYKKSC